jgi:hypothetical protein
MSEVSAVSKNNTSIFSNPKFYYASAATLLITGIVLVALSSSLLGGAGSPGFIAAKVTGSLGITAGVISFIWGLRMYEKQTKTEFLKIIDNLEKEVAKEFPPNSEELLKLVKSTKQESAEFLYSNYYKIFLNPEKINEQDKKGETLLHKAAKQGLILAILTLTAKGADLTLQDNAGNTPAQVAPRNNQLVIELLQKDVSRGNRQSANEPPSNGEREWQSY